MFAVSFLEYGKFKPIGRILDGDRLRKLLSGLSMCFSQLSIEFGRWQLKDYFYVHISMHSVLCCYFYVSFVFLEKKKRKGRGVFLL